MISAYLSTKLIGVKKMIHIGFFVSNEYVKYMSVAMASILSNASNEDDLAFHIITNTENKINQEKINQLKQIKDFQIEWKILNQSIPFEIRKDTRKDIPALANYSLLISSVFSNIDKIIWLDSDLIVLDSLAELYNTNMRKYSIAACPWPDVFQPDSYKQQISINQKNKYTNTGVLLANLKKWRKDKAEEKLLKAAHDFSGIYKFHCQCLFNIVFQNSLLYLPQKWNYRPMIWLNPQQVSPADLLTPPKIIHYANPTKPWSEIGAEKSEYFWQYARLSPFYEDIIYENSRTKLPAFIPNKNLLREILSYPDKLKKLSNYKWKYRLSIGKTRKRYKQKYKSLKKQINDLKRTLGA